MIWYYIILFFTSLLSAVFSWLPQVTTLPAIGGVDIDTALSTGVGDFYTYSAVVWPIHDVFVGLVVLMGYYTIKLVLGFFLGARAPK